MRTLLWASLGLAAFSCAGINKLEFHISAIDTSEKEIPCAIFFEDQQMKNEKGEPILTPAWIMLPFDTTRAEEKVIVRPAGDASLFLEDSRLVRPSDARRQLFVLRKNKPAGP